MLAGACASTPQDERTAQLCPPGRTLICTNRMGREQQCVCEREEKFVDILESSTGR